MALKFWGPEVVQFGPLDGPLTKDFETLISTLTMLSFVQMR